MQNKTSTVKKSISIVSFTQTRMESTESIYNEAKNLAKARGDYTFELEQA